VTHTYRNNHLQKEVPVTEDQYGLNPVGLASATVLRRLEEEGYNELPAGRSKRLYQLLFELIREPMVFLLIACGSIYLVLGDPQEAWMLLGFLFVIIGITLYQERKTERSLEVLKNLSSPRALVLRDGRKIRISGREVVREDIVFVIEGDRIPADGILISNSIINVDESLLTGESIPVEKEANKGSAPRSEKTSRSDRLYAGTTLVRGQGIMSVKATGSRTELGKIGKSIQKDHRESTQLEIQTRRLVRVSAWIAGALCVFVVIVYALTRGSWLDGFLAGLTLAMAILPNELPAVLTIFLALGAWRISQRRVLTRKISAVENLGAATVLCVDKTGTLTHNRMSIQKLFSQNRFLDLSDPFLKTLPEEFHEILEFGILASRQDPFDPMEKAFLTAGTHYLQGTEHLHTNLRFLKEYRLSPELLSITHAWQSEQKDENIIGAKGAPEAIIDLCHMDPASAKRISQVAEGMAKGGLRILGIAKSRIHSKELPKKQHDFDFEFVGLVGLADPVRPEVPQAIAECRSAGVRVIMITGDHPNTARSIARQIGLQNTERVVTGLELNQMNESDLQQVVKQVNIFSRMVPEQKLRLVRAFQKCGEVVAMTGDGVNDAPALKNADIGIAMGGRGTDVARESAAIVLLDDDFSSIVEAIRMGRRVYSNLRSALVYLLAVHVPIAGMSVLPVIFKLPLVLLPVHIAFLHLIIEPTSSIVFEAEPGSPMVMQTPPRDPAEPLFSKMLFMRSLIQGASVLVTLLIVYVVALLRGQGEQDARALTFTTLIISNLALIATSRASSSFIITSGLKPRNRTLRWIIGSSMVMLAFVLYIPSLRELFRFSTLHIIDIVICFTVGIFSVIWLELFLRLKQSFINSFDQKPHAGIPTV
jgi:Ca2+-transporting ATPase